MEEFETPDGAVSPASTPTPSVLPKNSTVTVADQIPSSDTESVKAIATEHVSDTGSSSQAVDSSNLVKSDSVSDLAIIPNAMNVLLDMNDGGQEYMVYESQDVESIVSPRTSSFAHPMPLYTTPPNLGLNRSFSLPPRKSSSQTWPGVGRYNHYSFSDYVSEL